MCSGGKIVKKQSLLIRPPDRDFQFTNIHGITWQKVKDAPTFDEIAPVLLSYLDDVSFIAAHNAPFDKSVFKNCCDHYGLEFPTTRWIRTFRDVSKKLWTSLYDHKLPTVCEHLSIKLNHHDALSDAVAAAEIILAAHRQGWRSN